MVANLYPQYDRNFRYDFQYYFYMFIIMIYFLLSLCLEINIHLHYHDQNPLFYHLEKKVLINSYMSSSRIVHNIHDTNRYQDTILYKFFLIFGSLGLWKFYKVINLDLQLMLIPLQKTILWLLKLIVVVLEDNSYYNLTFLLHAHHLHLPHHRRRHHHHLLELELN